VYQSGGAFYIEKTGNLSQLANWLITVKNICIIVSNLLENYSLVCRRTLHNVNEIYKSRRNFLLHIFGGAFLTKERKRAAQKEKKVQGAFYVLRPADSPM